MSTKTKRTRKSPEQHRAELEELHGQLADQVQQMTTSEGWTRWLRFARSFHCYSLNNLLLIWSQCPHATRVAGYRQWQAHGRQVRKGERGIKIVGYCPKKVTEVDPVTGQEEERFLPRFRVLRVFDVSQTDGEDLPTLPEPVDMVGEVDHGVTDSVRQWLTARGWTVTIEPVEGSALGYTHHRERRVVLDSEQSPLQVAMTALHEAAHVVLHSDPEVRKTMDRHTIEVEAESVTFIVAGAMGIDSSGFSTPYVAGWAVGDVEKVKATAARVLEAAQRLLQGITDPQDEFVGEEAPRVAVGA